tara:strand:- start:272 stop:628 length:357 start_codon:yes stop_codon:yes gene_type:complete
MYKNKDRNYAYDYPRLSRDNFIADFYKRKHEFDTKLTFEKMNKKTIELDVRNEGVSKTKIHSLSKHWDFHLHNDINLHDAVLLQMAISEIIKVDYKEIILPISPYKHVNINKLSYNKL